MDTLYILSLIGVGFFAVSGVLASGRKGFDLFGVVVIALVTAIGGGTLRDILLDRRPIFWIGDLNYLYFSLLGAFVALLWIRYKRPPMKVLLYMDALGLALFTVSGTQIADDLGFGAVIAILMGCITGVAGGVIRDMLSGEIPLLLRDREIYATASLLGAIAYLVFYKFGEVDKTTSAECGMLTVAIIRFAAISWRLRVPVFNPPEYK